MADAGTVVILAAGQGTRMRSAGPKVLHPICGQPMLGYVVAQAAGLEVDRVLVVTGAGGEQVESWLEGAAADSDAPLVTTVRQPEQRGTGHAVQCCLPALEGVEGPVVVLYGDMPCLRVESLRALLRAWEGAGRGVALLTAEPAEPRGFGRIVRGPGADGAVEAIVEEKDASAEQRAIREVNVGVYAFEAGALRRYLPRLSPQNAQGELYLTDVVGMAVAEGLPVIAVRLEDEAEAIGVNTLSHLAEARRHVQASILEEHLAAGVYIEDPDSTYIDHGVEIGAGTRVLPCTVIRAGVRIGEGCEVGPFTHLRVGTVLEDGAEVGNFTECKKARVGERSKAKHLSYLGDVTIGSKANIGAGTIVANYDGSKKHATVIGDRAFVGSGSVLIAPTVIGEGALTGGGAVVTRGSTVPDGDVWVGVPARPIRRPDRDEPSDESP